METAREVLVKPSQFMNQVLSRNGRLGCSACEILAAAINAVDPYEIIQQTVRKSQTELRIGEDGFLLHEIDRIFLIGFGKASVPMVKALLDVLQGEVFLAECVTKSKRFLNQTGYHGKLRVHLGGHPIPTKASLKATRAVLGKLKGLTPKDLVLVAISGGGSALFTDPFPGASLEDLRKMTDILLRSGADIHETNTLRKHLDRVKGGRLAQRLNPARVHTFILSDVVGDRLDMIASGPTVPDPTTYKDAIGIVEKYGLRYRLPESIVNILEVGERSEKNETLKEQDFHKMNVKNHLVGTNIKAARAAKLRAEAHGYNSLIMTSHLVGQTQAVAEILGAVLQTELEYGHPAEKPTCLIFGGETTVKVHGNGKGGRNQDLILHMVKKTADHPGVLVISLATDGEDGPTDAAGAASDAKVYRDGAAKLEMNIDTYIETNNSYNYFQDLGGLIKIGSTGTNVNDLIMILIDRENCI